MNNAKTDMTYFQARDLLKAHGKDCFQTAKMAQQELVGTWEELVKDNQVEYRERHLPMNKKAILTFLGY